MDHRYLNECFRCLRLGFVVFAQPPVPVEPPEGSLHHPAPRHYFETADVVVALHDLERPVAGVFCPLDQLTPVAAISPDKLEVRIFVLGSLKHQLGAIPVLHIRWVDDHLKQ